MHGNTKHLILSIGGATGGFSQFEFVLWLSKPTREIQLRTNVVIYVGHEGNKAWRKREGQGCGQSITLTKLVSLPYIVKNILQGVKHG